MSVAWAIAGILVFAVYLSAGHGALRRFIVGHEFTKGLRTGDVAAWAFLCGWPLVLFVNLFVMWLVGPVEDARERCHQRNTED